MNTISNSQTLFARILMSSIFILSGIGKIAAPAATMGYISAMGLPFPAIALGGAIAVEVIGGVLLLVGFRTKIVALALAAFTVVTGLIFHTALADQNQMIHLLKNFAMAGGLLQIATFGAGNWSVDALRAVKLVPARA